MEQHKQTYRINTQFALSVRFFVVHDYYVNGVCSDFSFQPSKETLIKLRNNRLRFRAVNGGFELAIDMSHDFTNPIYQREEVFQFFFKCNNPLFLQYTDMPFVSSALMLLDTAQTWGECLHVGTTFDKSQFLDTDNDGYHGVFLVRHQQAKPLWFDPLPTYQYYIRFGARKVKIRYIFYGNKDLVDFFSQFIIEESENTEKVIIFRSPKLILLKNGDQAFECVSEQEIPLKNLWNNPLVVKREKGNGTPFDYRKTLPYPKPEGVKFDETLNSFVTEVFVKL